MPNRRNAIYFFIAAALLAGLATGRAFFFNLAYLLGAVLIFSLLWAWLSIRAIAIARQSSTSRTQVGQRFEENFVVQNRGLLPKLFIEVRDESTLPGHRASHVVPWLSPRASYRWSVGTDCHTRGEFTLGALTIISGDPFGMFLLSRRLAATSRLLVYPLVVPIVRLALPSGMLVGGESNRRRSQSVTTDAVGVREYAPGDTFNRIHWRSSARRGELMVKEYETEPRLDIWLFVDFSADSRVEFPMLRRVNADGSGAVIARNGMLPPSSEEYAAAIAASLARHFLDQRRAIGFAAHTTMRHVFPPEPGGRQIVRIMEMLATAESTSKRTIGELLKQESAQIARGTTVVVITASLDPHWIAEAQIASRRGLRLVCILLDPVSFGGTQSSDQAVAALRTHRIPTFVVRYGDNLTSTLALPPV